MDQIVNSTKSHPFAAINMSTGAEATALTGPVCSYRIDGGEVVSPYSFVISALDSTMKTFTVTVPAALAATVGSSIEIYITAPEGEAHLIIDVVPDYSLLATASALATVDTVVDGIATTLSTPDTFKADVSALATSAEITALNNISAADVLTQVNTGLAAYDAPTKAEMDTAIDALPTAAEIVTAIDSDVIEGTFTRLQVMRILAAVLAGTRANANDVDTFTGLDGATARVVASVSSTGRTITTLDGD